MYASRRELIRHVVEFGRSMTSLSFDSDGVRIAYDDLGDGPPIVLIHGFASSRRGTWDSWFDTLENEDRRVIAIDSRGHGDSEKPHDPAAYEADRLSGDVVRLLDHLSIPTADLIGYSMGARISMHVLLDAPDRIQAAVLGGVGEWTLARDRYSDDIADALSADDPTDVTDPTAREFRKFARRRGNDLDALAACRRAPQAGMVLDRGTLSTIVTPVLVAAGSNDELVGAPGPLADAFDRAESVVVPDADHLETVDSPDFEAAVIAFLDEHGLT